MFCTMQKQVLCLLVMSSFISSYAFAETTLTKSFLAQPGSLAESTESTRSALITSMMLAATEGAVEKLNALLDAHQGVLTSEDVKQILIAAAKENHLSIIAFVLEHSVVANLAITHLYEVFHFSAQQGHDKIVAFILEHKKADEFSLEHLAATMVDAVHSGFHSVVDKITAHLRIRTMRFDELKRTAPAEEKRSVLAGLLIAQVIAGNIVKLKHLLDEHHGELTSEDIKHILIAAADKHHLDIVSFILEHSVIANFAIEHLFDFFKHAVKAGHSKVVEIILAHAKAQGLSIVGLAESLAEAAHAGFNSIVHDIASLLKTRTIIS